MPPRIQEVMTPSPVTLPGTTSVHEAARALRDRDSGDVSVMEHPEVCGIVTDRDLVVWAVAEARDPAAAPLADLCRHAVLTVAPTDPGEQAIRLMRTPAMRRLPVVAGGQAVGRVSLGDLAADLEPDSALGELSAAPPHP